MFNCIWDTSTSCPTLPSHLPERFHVCLSHVLAHESLMKVTPQHIVHKLLALPSLLRTSRLVLEYHIVVPPPLDRKVSLVQQRVAPRDVLLPLLRLGRRFFPLLTLALLLPFSFHPLQFTLKLCLLVVRVALVGVTVIIIIVIILVGSSV